MDGLDYSAQELVIGFHLLYNTARCFLLLPTVGFMARLCAWMLPEREQTNGVIKPRHLDPAALDTPSLALTNAVRETLRIGDVIDTSAVALISTCQLLPMPGSAKRIICGNSAYD